MFLARFLAWLGRLVCTGGDILVVVLLRLLHLFVVRYVAGVGHGSVFRLSKPASFPQGRNPTVGQTRFGAQTRPFSLPPHHVGRTKAGRPFKRHPEQTSAVFGFRFPAFLLISGTPPFL